MLRKLIFAVYIVGVTMPGVGANIASSAYVQDFYRNYCKNPMLNMPDDTNSGVASQRYIFSLIDRWNDNQTTYASSLDEERIVSAEYLPTTVGMLTDSYYCCAADNVFVNINTGVCQACGEWVRASKIVDACEREGTYRVGDACYECPPEFSCKEGTAGRALKLFCADEGEALFGGGCQSCKDGYMCPKNVELPQYCGAGNFCIENNRTSCTDTTLPDGTQITSQQRCSLQTLWFEPTADSIPCEETLTFTHTTTNVCTDPGQYINGTECVECTDGDGYECAAGTSGRILKLFCADAGEGLFEGKCEACRDGYKCPGGTEFPTVCGAGNYCMGDVRVVCPGGEIQCPLDNMWYAPETNVCTDTGIVKHETYVDACHGANEYRSNGRCVTCPDGYDCPDGTSGRVLKIFCSSAGEALYNNKCLPCKDGYMCPSGTEYPEACGTGNYCTGNVRTPCAGIIDADGNMIVSPEKQCPYNDMFFAPSALICSESAILTHELTTECLDEGWYRKQNKCVACPDGYTCPAGTNGRILDI